MDRIKQWMYYFIIGIISLIALIFLPMIGSTADLDWNIPNTAVGWIVWIVVKLIVAVINILIFHSFMQQAKLNIKNNPNYIEAKNILMQHKIKLALPRSPVKWNSQQYSKKGTMIFLTTALATIALTQAILSFDYIAMLTYLFTIIMGLIFGVLQMKSAEDYWTDEFYRYALMIKENHEREVKEALDLSQNKCTEQKHDNIFDNSRADILVSSSGNDNSSIHKPMVVDSSDSINSVLGGTLHASNTSTDRLSSTAEKVDK